MRGNFFKKFWNLLWKDNSLKGWIFSLVFIFAFIRFIFFPLLGLATGSALPLAIVESCSMYHQGDIFSNFNSWWQDHSSHYNVWGINKYEFSRSRFYNGFDKGDIMLVVGTKPQNIHLGDIIVYSVPGQSAPIIHRVVKISDVNKTYTFSTMGDNNMGQQLPFENNVRSDQVVGKAVFKIFPFFGWAKLIFFEVRKEFDNNPNTNFEGLCTGR